MTELTPQEPRKRRKETQSKKKKKREEIIRTRAEINETVKIHTQKQKNKMKSCFFEKINIIDKP